MAEEPVYDEITIHWGEEVHTTSELTVADMIAMEDEWGEAFCRIDFTEMKAACWLVWLVRRHVQPDLAFEAVASITYSQLAPRAEDAAVPPTSGSRKRASRSAGAGGRGTRASTASRPGTSSA